MPSPIAHSVAGYALSQLPISKANLPGRLLSITPWAALYGIVVSVLPDLDFIPQILTGIRFHRGPSHSLLAAVLVSFVITLGVYSIRRQTRFTELFLLTFGIYSAHLLMDIFTAGGDGLRVLWPLSDQYFKSPFAIFPRVRHDLGLWNIAHLTFISVELLYSLVLLGTIRTMQRRSRSQSKAI